MVVSLHDVRKSFGATRALQGVSFELAEGEIHALVGENGAGKSTLINVLAGVVRPDTGQLLVGGMRLDFQTPQDAQAVGIATVFQELSLVDGLSVAENICGARAPSRFGLIDRNSQRARAIKAMALLGVQMPPEVPVGRLMASQRQLVEVAKALDQLFWAGRSTDAVRVLILDEPTSALNADEKAALFSAVRMLRSQGVSIIYISHHLDEVLALADRITVLRDGATVWTKPAAGMGSDALVHAMVGRDVQRGSRCRGRAGNEAARFEAVGKRGKIEGISVALRGGEVLGVAGLDGSGRETVARLLVGLERPDAGRIMLKGLDHPGTLRGAMAMGVGYVPDDRKELGLFLDLSISENTVAADLSSVTRRGLIRADAAREAGTDVIQRHGVKANSPDQAVGALSGGNQQKVLFGKWLRRNPSLLIVEEPTKGVDIGSKRDIHDQLVALARAGAAVLVVSSDLPEILELSDRIMVLHRGRIAGILDGATAREEMVMALASGSIPIAA